MIKNGLIRHKVMVALMALLLLAIVCALIVNNHLDKNIIQRDYFSASRTEVLGVALDRVGANQQELQVEILEHLNVLLNGGQLSSSYGPSWYKPAVTDERIIASILSVTKAAQQADGQAFELAYRDFNKLSTQINFEELRQYELIRSTVLVLIVLSLLAVLGSFLLRLWRSDEHVELMQSENNQILSAVENGLFLIDRQYRIGAQKSHAVSSIFGEEDAMEGDFFKAMSRRVSKENLALTRDYIDLLFEGRVLQELIQDVNPLREVEVEVVNEAGGNIRKFLNFNFSRNERIEENDTILASVSDVTNEVLLRRELEKTKEHQKERINLFIGLLHVTPEKLVSFCDDTIQEMRSINQILANEDLEDSRMRNKLNDIFRRAHRVKGDATALGLSLFESSLHRFESKIEKLLKMKSIDGRNVLELTVQLKEMVGETEMVRSIAPQLKALVGSSVPESEVSSELNDISLSGSDVTELQPVLAELQEVVRELQPEIRELQPEIEEPKLNVETCTNIGVLPFEGLKADLQNLVSVVSKRQGKDVQLTAKGLMLLKDDSDLSKSLGSVCVQLVRNSVVHGIEPADQRLENNKPSSGLIGINLRQTNDNCIELIVRDDGQGLQYNAIRERAIKSNLLSPEQAESIQDIALLKYIFVPGFSSLDEANLDAGRGIGLDFVRKEVKRLDGKLVVNSKAGAFTKFVLTLPLAA